MQNDTPRRNRRGLIIGIIAAIAGILAIPGLAIYAANAKQHVQDLSDTGYYQLMFDQNHRITEVVDNADPNQPDTYPYFQWGYDPESGSFVVGAPAEETPGLDAYLELKGSVMIDGVPYEVTDSFKMLINLDAAVNYYNQLADLEVYLDIDEWYGLQFAVMDDARQRIANALDAGIIPTPVYAIADGPNIRTDEHVQELYRNLLAKIDQAGTQKVATAQYCATFPSIKQDVPAFCSFDPTEEFQTELEENFGFECASYDLALTNRDDILSIMELAVGDGFTYSIGKTAHIRLDTALPCMTSPDYGMVPLSAPSVGPAPTCSEESGCSNKPDGSAGLGTWS